MDIPEFLSEFAQSIIGLDYGDIFLVGGSVRDLWLGQSVSDYDLLCSGDAIQLAEKLESKGLIEILALHIAFGTAKVRLVFDERVLDIASPRLETYAFPGALPTVTYPASLEEDLKRRDFTINAIALRLGKPTAQHFFLDPFDGLQDLKAGIVQVLHPISYIEDPTRVIRALRFARRFDFRIGSTDRTLIREALSKKEIVGMTARVRGLRVGIELKRLLESDHWLNAAIELAELGGWSLCRARLDQQVQLTEPLYQLPTFEMRLAWLLWRTTDRDQILGELGLNAKALKKIELIETLSHSQTDKPSLALLSKYEQLNESELNLLYALRPSLKEFYRLMHNSKPQKKGADLLREGIQGQAIQAALEEEFQLKYQSHHRKD
ncbi:MAG: hypothetical protein SFT81_08045 [Candidatus Caenarcaniphilales bacterium]|nr:hypothetical protein [Candidatus Caenarcaniphilales bacterium]